MNISHTDALNIIRHLEDASLVFSTINGSSRLSNRARLMRKLKKQLTKQSYDRIN